MPRPAILDTDEKCEASYRQTVAEFKEDIYPALRDEGMTIGEGLIFYQLVCLENRLIDIRNALDKRYD